MTHFERPLSKQCASSSLPAIRSPTSVSRLSVYVNVQCILDWLRLCLIADGPWTCAFHQVAALDSPFILGARRLFCPLRNPEHLLTMWSGHCTCVRRRSARQWSPFLTICPWRCRICVPDHIGTWLGLGLMYSSCIRIPVAVLQFHACVGESLHLPVVWLVVVSCQL